MIFCTAVLLGAKSCGNEIQAIIQGSPPRSHEANSSSGTRWRHGITRRRPPGKRMIFSLDCDRGAIKKWYAVASVGHKKSKNFRHLFGYCARVKGGCDADICQFSTPSKQMLASCGVVY
jgi:hypothetical protein